MPRVSLLSGFCYIYDIQTYTYILNQNRHPEMTDWIMILLLPHVQGYKIRKCIVTGENIHFRTLIGPWSMNLPQLNAVKATIWS